MAITISQIQSTADAIHVALDDNQAALLVRFRDLLIEWNARFNLTAITDDDAILVRHFADSLTALRALPSQSGLHLIDVGSGAGLPGIPLKIARPDLDITLMDSTGKKVGFCTMVIHNLHLDGIRAVHARAEEAAHQRNHRAQYDIALARAVAPLPILVEYVLPFVRQGGLFIAMKGGDAWPETEKAQRAIHALGGELDRVEGVILPGVADQRALVIIRKVKPSPSRYPRPAGQPRSAPL